MATLIQWLLPLYFVVYFGAAFVLKSVITAKRTGINPLVLPKDDSAYGLVGFYFKITLLLLFVYVMVYALAPGWHPYFLPALYLQHQAVQIAGCALLALALVLTVVAQVHMKDSWRIGIDTKHSTALVTTGMFAISRNPIFLGMLLSLAGLWLLTPNAVTLLLLVTGYILIQVQIRLEEEFLARQHGSAYLEYKRKVRRLI